MTKPSVVNSNSNTLTVIFDYFCVICLRTCHAIAKHWHLFADYAWQCTPDTQKGMDVGNTYRNVKACREFVHTIAEVERRHLVQNLEKAQFLSLISDGTTDSSISEAEIVFVQHSVNGAVSTAFVGVETVANADAPSIKRAINGVVEKHLQFPKKLY